jgi:GNAT superfamily N-acetyltransferase
MAAVEIVRGGVERLDEVGPIWRSLSDHHAEITPAGLPVRPSAEGWLVRGQGYERALADGAVLLIAQRASPNGAGDALADDAAAPGESVAVGYALAAPKAAPVNLAIERILDVETVAVLPEARGEGIGAALMDAVRELAAELGIDHIQLSVRTANEGALRFYARQGFAPLYVTLVATREDSARSTTGHSSASTE